MQSVKVESKKKDDGSIVDDGEVVRRLTFSGDDVESPIVRKADLPAVPPAPKALHERHSLEFIVIIIGASALAFNAGFVNGSTYQFRNIPVSHVTGTTTKAGMSLGNNDYDGFALDLCLIVCFIFGAGISGSILKSDSFQLGRAYGPLFIVGSALFLLACLTSYYYPSSDFYFYFAAMACGIQNSLTTKYSGSIIRTTHMTGAATDIGLTLGKICMGDYKDAWKLLVLVPLFVSFLLGGLTSIFAFKRFGQLTLFINVILFFSIGAVYSIVVGQQKHIPFWKAMLGMYNTVEEGVTKSRKRAKSFVRRVKTHLVSIKQKIGAGKRSATKSFDSLSSNSGSDEEEVV
eukprot:gene25187-30420_t